LAVVQFPMLFWLSSISGWSLILWTMVWPYVISERLLGRIDLVVLLACWWILGYRGVGTELSVIDIWQENEGTYEYLFLFLLETKVTMIIWDRM
jgi:hypothetical protein